MRPETLWIPHKRRTVPPRHRAPGAGGPPAPGGTPGPGGRWLRLSMAPGLAAGGRGGLGPPAEPGAAAPVDRPAVPPAGRAVGPGGPIPWRCQRAGDLVAHRGRDAGALWGARSPGTRLEARAPPGLEVSGARRPGQPTRRTDHGALEALPVAGHKKKPDDLGPTSPSWMRVGFGFFLRYDYWPFLEHGLPRGTCTPSWDE
jgi:hypothetical protein